MRCAICDTSAAPHELVEGKCLKCLHLENSTLRLLMAHVLLSIDTGPTNIGDPAWRLYKPEFTQSFVDHLRQVLGPVNSETKLFPKFDYAPPNERPTWWVNEHGQQGAGHGADPNNASGSMSGMPAAKNGDNLVIFTTFRRPDAS